MGTLASVTNGLNPSGEQVRMDRPSGSRKKSENEIIVREI